MSTPTRTPASARPAATTGGHVPAAVAPPGTGRYVLGAEIARGGMGIVYRAVDAVLDREVAVKVLQGGHGVPPGSARRFSDEARITAQLQHPAIPPVHDLSTLPDGRPFLAMKLIKGETLEDLLAERPEPGHDRGRFVAAFEQVCQALAYAHAHGVIHRDLKPSNVMVEAFGEVQVMDWGLAKVLGAARPTAPEHPVATAGGTEVRTPRGSDDRFTEAGSILGTPAYIPPEQAIGAVDRIDARSDVFGLGGILAVILTGHPPFVGETSEGTRQLAAGGKVQNCFGRLDASGADPELVALCKRCLAPDKEDRPADAGEVARAVAALRQAADERARRAELDRVKAEAEKVAADLKAAEQRKRTRLSLALAGAVALLLLGGGAFAWYWDRQAAARGREQTAARAAARQNLETALDRASAALREDHAPAASAALDRAAELLDSADAPDLRERYQDLRADLTAVAELNRVWSRASTVLHEQAPGTARRVQEVRRFDEEAARTGYPAAFAARGLAIDTTDPGDVADRITRSPARDRLVAALDDWLPVSRPEDRTRLCELLARVDPDPARTAVRRAHIDPATLPVVLANPPAEALRVAARAAMTAPLPDDQVRPVLRAAAARYPDDFRIQYAAGVRADAREAAVAYLRAAVALRPDNAAAVYTLGSVLYPVQLDEGAGYLLRAIELDPGLASAYLGLADAIKNGADPSRAIAHFEREIARDGNQPMAHFGLGMSLRDRQPERAAGSFTRSIALDDKFAPAHNYLGYVLSRRQDVDERIRCYRRAIELDPTFAFPHYNLAGALRVKGDLPGAEAEYRAALKLLPGHALSHFQLGELLAAQGKAEEAAGCWLATIRSDRSYFPAYERLGGYLLRTGKPAEAAEVYRECVGHFPGLYVGYDGLVLALARQGHHAGAVGVYVAVALRGFPEWPAEVQQRLRYNAACSAAQVGAGLGRDSPPGSDRAVFRWQALAWLRAELALRRQQAASPIVAERKKAVDTLSWWLRDPDLSCVRPGLMRIGLSAGERAEWDSLWADVRATLADAPDTPTPEVAPRPRAK